MLEIARVRHPVIGEIRTETTTEPHSPVSIRFFANRNPVVSIPDMKFNVLRVYCSSRADNKYDDDFKVPAAGHALLDAVRIHMQQNVLHLHVFYDFMHIEFREFVTFYGIPDVRYLNFKFISPLLDDQEASLILRTAY